MVHAKECVVGAVVPVAVANGLCVRLNVKRDDYNQRTL